MTPLPPPNIDELLDTLAAVLFALVACIAVVAAFGGCSPIQCRKATIILQKHATLPRPAAKIVIGCDDRKVLELDAVDVQ